MTTQVPTGLIKPYDATRILMKSRQALTEFDFGDPEWYPGNNIPPVIIPNGKQCFYMANVQSTAVQQVTMVDANNRQLFQLTGKSSSGTTLTPIGSSFFVASNPTDTYTLTIGAYQGSTLQWSHVVLGDINLYMGANVYCYNYVFVAADSWDQIPNADCSVSIYWLMYAG